MTTYFVDPTNGDDATGNGLSFATAWKSTQKGVDNLTAGDELRLCATGVESITAGIVMDIGVGGQTSDTLIRGMDGTNGTTPSTYTIRIASSATEVISYNTTAKGQFIKWRDIVFDANGVGTNAISASVSTIAFSEFLRCEFINATGDGLALRDARWHFVECDIHDNGDDGVFCNNPLTYTRWHGCRFYDNAGRGLRLEFNTSRFATITRCVFYGNGAAGVSLRADLNHGTLVDHCTFYDNGGDGIESDGTTYGLQVTDCVFQENGGYGEDHAGASRFNITSHKNCYYINTAGASRNALIGDTTYHLTSDPQLGNPASGDFVPGSSSPLIGAGTLGSTIGAYEPAAGGGGGSGGLLLHPGMAGGMRG